MQNRPVTPDQADVMDALGESEAFLDFQERLSRVAPVDRPVLLLGERGTGKELAARRLHYLSARWREPLVQLNCAALAPTLIESELFGYEPGAFTGATAQRRGRFESADGGTLFLDELGNIPIFVQEKILRVVEYGVFERVGGSEVVAADVRIVGATNADLGALCAEGRFMPDLLDRLSFEALYLPPLRERHGDVLLLARHFAAHMALELGRRESVSFSPEVEAQLEAYPWPGNIRELKNVVERAVYRTDGAEVHDLCFDPFAAGLPAKQSRDIPRHEPTPDREQRGRESPLGFKEAVEEHEIALLRQALDQCQYNQRRAAARLGLSYHQFRGLYRKYGALLV